MLNKGKPSREHTYPAIRAALLSLLRAWGSPFTLTNVPQGCRIAASAADITGAHARLPRCHGLCCAVLGREGEGWVVAASAARITGASALCSAVRFQPAFSHPGLASPSPTPSLSLTLPPHTAWLHTPKADRALAAYNARADGGRAPLAKEVFFQEDAGAEVRGAGPININIIEPT